MEKLVRLTGSSAQDSSLSLSGPGSIWSIRYSGRGPVDIDPENAGIAKTKNRRMNLSILRPFECGFNNLYSIPTYILNSEVSFVKLNSQKWTHWVSFISLSFFPQFTTDWNSWNLSGWTPIVLTFSFFAVLYIISLIVWVDTGNTYSNSLPSVVVGALITILNLHSKTPFRFFCINFFKWTFCERVGFL